MRLNNSVLDELIHEYCVYRGIVDSGVSTQPGKYLNFKLLVLKYIYIHFPTLSTKHVILPIGMEVTYGAADDETAAGQFQGNLMEINCRSSKVLDGESSNNNIQSNGFSGCHSDTMTETTDISERYPSEVTPNHGAECSTSGHLQVQNFKVLQRIRNYGIGERNKRKRWRGRQEMIDFMPEVSGSTRKEVTATIMTFKNSSVAMF